MLDRGPRLRVAGPYASVPCTGVPAAVPEGLEAGLLGIGRRAHAPVGLGALIGGGRPPPVGGRPSPGGGARPGYGAAPTPTANTAVPAEAVPEVTEHANLERAKPSPKRRPPTKKPRTPAAAE